MTMFIKLENELAVGYPLVQENMEYLFPDFNFNQIVTPAMVQSLGYGIYEFSQQPSVERYKKIVEGTPQLNPYNGIWFQNWEVVDKTPEECLAEDKEQEESIRRLRDGRLYMTDWSQLPDSPLSEEKKLEYKNYRQALRDVSLQEGFPWNVQWPVDPSE